MVRLRVISSNTRGNSNLAHRASVSEGEAAKRLLESEGYVFKSKAKGQYATRCPFHEGPGAVESRKSPNFYLDAESSKYFCQSAGCGERGNLLLLERFFGVDQDDDFVVAYRDRDTRLKEYEANLTKVLRLPFYEHGLSDVTIERFRLGYEPEHTEQRDGRSVTIPGRHVIPYLEGRRPRFFRYYAPEGEPKWKYTWESGAESTLFNAQDAMGDADGRVILAEGELKAMLLVQMGYAAVGVPGATQWKDEFQAAFTHARSVVICYDNDNPAFHDYDRPERNQPCRKCEAKGLSRCAGHNPGQDAALNRLEQIGWRAKNVVLPLPSDQVPKTDVNDYFMRDGHSNTDFAELVTGKRATPYRVASLAEITASPPDEAEFLIAEGILSAGGRLLVAGKPKVGKSIFVNNLALALASGIPFLKSGSFGGFAIDHPTRTLLLDRELSRWSLFKRLRALIEDRAGLRAAEENLLIDHDHLIRLDQVNAYETLLQMVEQNGAETVILDTAYKFFGGDIESSASLNKGFEVLDKIIHQTGCSFILTHHHKKTQGGSGRQSMDVADPDNVAGSYLWTGWPNGTILLNFLDRSVENPYNSIATFTAFRDAAPPEPLALYRSRESIAYTSIEPYSFQAATPPARQSVQVIKPTTEMVSNLLLEQCPITEEEFLHRACGYFGVTEPTLRPFYLDMLSQGDFEKSKGYPTVLSFKFADTDEQSWEAEHGLAEQPIPDNAGASLDVSLFEGVQL